MTVLTVGVPDGVFPHEPNQVPAACKVSSCMLQSQRCPAVIPTAPLKVTVTAVQGPEASVNVPPVASPVAAVGVHPVPTMVNVVPPLLTQFVPLQKVKAGVPSVVKAIAPLLPELQVGSDAVA